MVNPFEWFPLWRAMRHHSLTAAVVFASALLGFSVVKLLRWALGELSLPWIFLWLVPLVVIGFMARNERRVMPDERLRRRLATAIALGALAIYLTIAVVRARFGPPEPDSPRAPHSERGPRSK